MKYYANRRKDRQCLQQGLLHFIWNSKCDEKAVLDKITTDADFHLGCHDDSGQCTIYIDETGFTGRIRHLFEIIETQGDGEPLELCRYR